MLLGVDVGSSRAKAVLIDAQGREVARGAVVTPFVDDRARIEMDVGALRACVRDLVVGLGPARSGVAAVGVAGIAESGAPLDAGRRAVAPIIAWHDGRGREAAAVLQRRFGPELPARIGQQVRAVLTAAKLGWLVEDGLRGMVRWLGVPELVLHALTGAEATEFSLAARTGCYDVAALEWIPEVGRALGFSVDVFPAVRAAGTIMGRVSAAGASWSGVAEGVPVTVAGHDHLAGMAGAGVDRGSFANSVGTAETILARSATVPDPATAAAARVAVTVHPGGREWVALVSAARAGLVLDAAARALGRPVEELDRLADGQPPVDVADPVDVLARGEPAVLAAAPPGPVWAGLLHALAGRTAESYRRLSTVVGPARRLVVYGGGSRSGPWLAAKSAVIPVPVEAAGTAWAVARGAAVHAGVAAGWWPSADEGPEPEPARSGTGVG